MVYSRCAFGQQVFQYNCMKLWLGVVARFVWSRWECCVCSQCMHTFPAIVGFYHVLLRGCGICLGRFPNLLCSIFQQFISFLPDLCSENILYVFYNIYVYERVLQCYYAKTVGIWSFVWTLYILPSIGCRCCYIILLCERNIYRFDILVL